MSFNGSGTYSLVAGLEANLANGQPNDGTEVYAAFADIATALSTCVTKDGQTTVTANVPMAGYIFTGLGAGSSTGHSLRYEQVFSASSVTLLGGLTIPGLLTLSDELAVGTSNIGTTGVSLAQNYNLSWEQSATESLPGIFRTASSAALTLGYGVKYSGSANAVLSSYGAGSVGQAAIAVQSEAIKFSVNAAATVAVDDTVTLNERMRITPTAALFGRSNETNLGSFTNTVAGLAYVYGSYVHLARDSANSKLVIQDITNRSGSYISFGSGSTTTGNISTDGTATAYNTTSDGRLKENVRRITNVGSLIDAVNPVEFDWSTDQSKGHGFIAQELFQIFPGAVTPGDPDFDLDPVTKRPWMIDYAKIVPYLVAEIQDLRRRVAALESQ